LVKFMAGKSKTPVKSKAVSKRLMQRQNDQGRF